MSAAQCGIMTNNTEGTTLNPRFNISMGDRPRGGGVVVADVRSVSAGQRVLSCVCVCAIMPHAAKTPPDFNNRGKH